MVLLVSTVDLSPRLLASSFTVVSTSVSTIRLVRSKIASLSVYALTVTSQSLSFLSVRSRVPSSPPSYSVGVLLSVLVLLPTLLTLSVVA